MSDIDPVDDTKQITKGKGRLRAQIRELETQLIEMRRAPLRREAERLARENARLLDRVKEVEATAAEVVEAALKLARLAVVVEE